jgi:hypothetical protein
MYFQLFFAHFDFKLKLHWTPASYYQDCLCEFSNIIDNHPSRSNTEIHIYVLLQPLFSSSSCHILGPFCMTCTWGHFFLKVPHCGPGP